MPSHYTHGPDYLDKDKKKKGTLWDSMKKVKPTLGSQTAYKNYVISGGRSDYQTWQKENK